MDVPAVVVTYEPEWPGLLRELRGRVGASLAGIAHVTEHAGSTAVSRLDAKPIIDLDAVVSGDAATGKPVKALAVAGCGIRASRHYRPGGIPGTG